MLEKNRLQRERVIGTVDRISKINASQSSNFMVLFKLSGLPLNHFKGETLHALDLSDSDLRTLDLTDTKFIDCIISNTTFPPNFDKNAQCLNSVSSNKHNQNISDISLSLIEASKNGDIDKVKNLIRNGAQIDFVDDKHETALIAAVRNNHDSVVSFLLDNDADVNVANNINLTPLMLAVPHGNISFFELLLEKGADIHATTDDGKTALMKATEVGLVEAVKLLLEKGADIDASANDGKTALMLAAQNGHSYTLEFLIKGGADIHAATVNGKTALSIAKEEDYPIHRKINYLEVINLLIKHGAKMAAVLGVFSLMGQLL